MHKVYGLVGFPLSHSWSAAWFGEKFKAAEFAGNEYRLFEIPEVGQIRPTLQLVQRLRGFNVTIPHKQHILPLLNATSAEAAAIGAVNCISVDSKGQWTGHNTDAPAFRKTLLPFLTHHHARALIIGNGGAAAAVSHVLRSLGIEITIVSRNSSGNVRTFADLSPEWLRQCKLIVNTTPLGQFPAVESIPPIPLETIGPDHLVYDLVYNPTETRLIYEARQKRATVLNGLELLHLQAELSWKIWSGDPD